VTEIDPRPELIESARHFYQQGWMVGTAGNLSAKLEDGSFWITASGCAKGRLLIEDFVRVRSELSDLQVLEGGGDRRPSAETSIHAAVYDLFPTTRACFHVHSVAAILAGKAASWKGRAPWAGELALPPLEMLKGFGLWLEKPEVSLPVFENYLEVPAIAKEISRRFRQQPPAVPALLIENHGVTVWGDSLMDTFHHLEIAEFIFAYMVAANKSLGVK
jgi:methylthioribulose-1-phosphate dehydratase